MSLTLADANRLANAAIAEASKSGTAISVSICDATGRLVAHQRMDGVFGEASLFSLERQSQRSEPDTIAAIFQLRIAGISNPPPAK